MFEDQTLVVDHYGNYFYVPNTSLVVDQYGNYYVKVLYDDTPTQQYQNPNIGNYACYGCSGLKKIMIPKSTKVGDSAFKGCWDVEIIRK